MQLPMSAALSLAALALFATSTKRPPGKAERHVFRKGTVTTIDGIVLTIITDAHRTANPGRGLETGDTVIPFTLDVRCRDGQTRQFLLSRFSSQPLYAEAGLCDRIFVLRDKTTRDVEVQVLRAAKGDPMISEHEMERLAIERAKKDGLTWGGQTVFSPTNGVYQVTLRVGQKLAWRIMVGMYTRKILMQTKIPIRAHMFPGEAR